MRIRIPMIIVLSIATLCSSRRQEDIGCKEFEFKNLNKDTNKWKEEASFEHVSDSFFKEGINRIRELKFADPKSLYRVCDVTAENLNGVVVAQLNGPAWDMYFIPKSSDKAFMLACYEVSPDDYLMKKSKLDGEGNLEMTKIYISYEGGSDVKDS